MQLRFPVASNYFLVNELAIERPFSSNCTGELRTGLTFDWLNKHLENFNDPSFFSILISLNVSLAYSTSTELYELSLNPISYYAVIDETVFDFFYKGLRDLPVFSTRLKQVTKVSLSHFLLTILQYLYPLLT